MAAEGPVDVVGEGRLGRAFETRFVPFMGFEERTTGFVLELFVGRWDEIGRSIGRDGWPALKGGADVSSRRGGLTGMGCGATDEESDVVRGCFEMLGRRSSSGFRLGNVAVRVRLDGLEDGPSPLICARRSPILDMVSDFRGSSKQE